MVRGQIKCRSPLQITCHTLLLKIIKGLFPQKEGHAFQGSSNVASVPAVTTDVTMREIFSIVDENEVTRLEGVLNRTLKFAMKSRPDISNLFEACMSERMFPAPWQIGSLRSVKRGRRFKFKQILRSDHPGREKCIQFG